jgi:hypothetical protein
MAQNESKVPNEVSHEDYLAAARSALAFCVVFILTLIALWGYVYSLLLERGMTQ